MIQIQELSFSYPGKTALFQHLNLDICDGNIYGLLGKNGAGKTTLLKVITGLLFPKKGDCQVLETDPTRRLPSMLREIYFIPEIFYTPPITVREYEALYADFYPRFSPSDFRVHLQEFQLHPTDKLSALSYGQKKKFLIAFGLATRCRLLILDEPTNGLDIPSKSQFRKLLAASIDEHRTFIISTHQVRDIGNLIDPIIILDEGRIIFHHTIEKICQTLSVRLVREEPDPEQILFSEKTLGGYTVLETRGKSADNNIDIELLFNAIVTHPERIRTLFQREA